MEGDTEDSEINLKSTKLKKIEKGVQKKKLIDAKGESNLTLLLKNSSHQKT